MRHRLFTAPALRSRLTAWCLALVTACLGSLARADEAPPLVPFEATYSAAMEKGMSLNGQARRSLTDQGNGVWLYRTDVDSFIADIDESVILKWENGRVVPLRYRYRLSGFLVKDREQSIDFNWQAGVATGRYKGRKFELPLAEGILDPLGYQLQLHQDIKAGIREMSYQVIDRAKYDEERFEVIDEEQISSEGRRTTALKAEKVREADAKRQTLMWFDPARNHLLVRLLQVEPDGSRYELALDDVRLGQP